MFYSVCAIFLLLLAIAILMVYLTKLLQGRDPILVSVVLQDGGYAVRHEAVWQSLHRHLRRIQATDQCLEALVGKRGLATVQLYNPGGVKEETLAQLSSTWPDKMLLTVAGWNVDFRALAASFWEGVGRCTISAPLICPISRKWEEHFDWWQIKSVVFTQHKPHFLKNKCVNYQQSNLDSV